MRKSRFTRALLLWSTFFLLYAATTAHDILPADSGEFQLTAAGWGIAHPPGYALYTLISALWLRLIPLGSVPFRTGLLSAALAATTLLLVDDAVRTWATAWGLDARCAQTGGLAATVLLGCAGSFWAQATTANIRMPTVLFVAWGFRAVAHWRADVPSAEVRARHSWSMPPLLELALVLGLGVGHHPSIIFVAVGWALYLHLIDPELIIRPRRWWKAVPIAALAWLLPQLYLPIRDSMQNVPLAPGDLATWNGFWDHVLARGFGGDIFAFATRADLAQRLPLLPTLFRRQFPPVFLVAIVASWLWLLWRHRKLALSLLLSWALHTFVTITYRAPQTIEYLMPAYVPMAIAFGLGTATLANAIQNPESRIHKRALRFTFYVLAAILLLRFPSHYADFADLARDTSIRDRVAPLLETAPSDALILADWRWATPLWVLQQTEGLNPDVEVAYVYPIAGEAYEDVWRTRAEAAGDRPVFTTHSFAWDGWTFAPIGGGFRLYPRPLAALADALSFSPLDADLTTIRILGYRIEGDVKPGRSIELQLAWQAAGPQEPAPSFTARLWDANGLLLAQADRALGSDTGEREVRFTRITLQMPIDRCTDTVQLVVGGYTVQDGAFQDLGSTTLSDLAATCDYPRLPVTRFWPGVVSSGGPVLRGVDYDTHGNHTTAYVHWCGPGQALTVSSGEQHAIVAPLRWGACQTVRLPIPANERPSLTFSRADGSDVHLHSLPLPAPKPDERYVPFGDAMVLVSARAASIEDTTTLLNLVWRAGRPIVDDYAVSVRFLGPDGTWLGMHDIQPGLGALPTLKWVTRDGTIRDPHPASTDQRPTAVAISLYERFRMTPLPSPHGDVATFDLSQRH